MTAQSTEQRELQLVQSVDFKILGVANQGEKLHRLLQRYLVPLILKAASDHASVRLRVLEILNRLPTFIQSPEVVLPVKALLQQYKSNDAAAIKNLDLMFVLHSIDRLSVAERQDLMPTALAGFAKDEGRPNAAAMLNIILKLLIDVRIPPRGSPDDVNFRNTIGLVQDSDAQYLAVALGIFLRLRPPVGDQGLADANIAITRTELDLFLSRQIDSKMIFERLAELKIKAITFLASAAFKDEERFLPALFAASGHDTRVAATAEEIIKRSTVSLEDRELVRRLFLAHMELPAPYRIRILLILSRSTVATTMTESILAVTRSDIPPVTAAEVTAAGSRHGDLSPTLNDSARTARLQPTSLLERTKLHKALLQFLSWVAQVGPSGSDFTIGGPLIQEMKSFIERQGWPIPANVSQDSVALRSMAYQTIGMVARSAHLAVAERLELGRWLFKALSEDNTSEAVVNIDGALSSLAVSVSAISGEEVAHLKSMLLAYMLCPDEPPAVRSTRHAVVKWANQCLPFSDVIGRWIDILAVAGRSGERNDVIEQGQKGLDPWTFLEHANGNRHLPDWKVMATAYFGTHINSPMQASWPSHSDSDILPEPLSHPDSDAISNQMGALNFQGSRSSAFPVALRYVKQMMVLAALKDFDLKPDWQQILDAQLATDEETGDKIRAYLRSVDSAYIVFYLKTCFMGAFMDDLAVAEESLRCLVQVAAWCPGGCLAYVASDGLELLPLTKSNSKEIRSLAAKALGSLGGHPVNGSKSVETSISALKSSFANAENLIGSEANAAEGALLALGHLISRCVYYDRDFPPQAEFPLRFLLNESVSSSLYEAALESFSQLWAAGLAIPPTEGDSTLQKIIDKLSSDARKANEKAIAALGALALGLEESRDDREAGGSFSGVLGNLLESLFALHEIKRVEVHFAVGDAIAAAIGRWQSKNVKLKMDVEARSTESLPGARSDQLIDAALERLLQSCKGTKPSLLKASGIWLFCLVQFDSQLSPIKSRLREVQAAFMRLLSARDELVQETASRGLSLVYERGDADLKSSLVKDLVSAFTGSAAQLKVDDETELFEPGALPTGEGNSVTSYKDIVNLANEVGDQRLVYKFMSLAANAATWSTRSAFGRFGLSNILSESEVDPKLYPKLYRYRFDPNKNVQRSMDDIWKALVKDSNATVEAHFSAIIEDLLKSILGREWRVREASCAAISHLISGRPFPHYERYYRDIWTNALKVLDDVKGSVRQAASRLCMTLSNSLVRQLEEGNHSSTAKMMMEEALPFLLSDKGVESTVQDVQLFATVTVMEITKHGGQALKPFISSLIPQLLGLLSTVEPEQINYAYQRAGESNRDRIDKIRSQMVNQSPISEAIENCLRFIDAGIMAEFAPKFEATIKTAIGMPTKIGCSRVITTLATRHGSDVQQVSVKLLRILEKQTMDKNDEVSQAYARAAAYMMRPATDMARMRFCEKFINMYFEAEDEIPRQKVADVIVAVAKISPDHFTAHETLLLPFAYLGSHDTDEYVAKLFREVWDLHAGSSRTVMRYVHEIVGLVERCLETAQWTIRHTGAFTVAAMAADVANASEAAGSIDEASLKTIWPAFDKALALKTFPGKEKVLSSFPQFVERGEPLWGTDSAVSAQMKKIAIREAKRNNDEYRPDAFTSLWKFAKARPDLDMLNDIESIAAPYLKDVTDEDKMDIDAKENRKEVLTSKTIRSAFEAIARGYSRSQTHDIRIAIRRILESLESYLANARLDLIKRDVWYECVCDLMTDAIKLSDVKTPLPSPYDSTALIASYVQSLNVNQGETGTEAQRLARVKALSKILEAKDRGVFGQVCLPDTLEADVVGALGEERSLDVQKAWRGLLEELRQSQKR